MKTSKMQNAGISKLHSWVPEKLLVTWFI